MSRWVTASFTRSPRVRADRQPDRDRAGPELRRPDQAVPRARLEDGLDHRARQERHLRQGDPRRATETQPEDHRRQHHRTGESASFFSTRTNLAS